MAESTAAVTVRVRTCPELAVETGRGVFVGPLLGSRKARSVLALLACAGGEPVGAEEIAEVLWPARAPSDPAANVATLVSRLRRLLGEDVVVARGRTYALSPECVVDVGEARVLVREAQDRAVADETALAAAAAQRALDLLGPVLVGEEESARVLALRREVEELRRTARHLLTVAGTGGASVAREAVAADPLDERAARDLMRALVAEGNPAAALAAYGELAGRLRDELGTDPDPRTSAVHLALLREEPLPPEAEQVAAQAPRRRPLLGRDDELAVLQGAWARASDRRGGLLVLEGEPGIGKTRMLGAAADLARETGGRVVSARCRPAESSLFLQPFVDAVRPVLLGTSAAEVRRLVEGHVAAWLALLPELAEVVGPVEAGPLVHTSPVMGRRRAYDAVAALLRRLAGDRPVLVCLDDLQDAGSASIDLLAHLATRTGGGRLLLVGAVRSEDQETLGRLAAAGSVLTLGALPGSAVEELAAAAGLPERAAEVLARTAGHSLSVVEFLRALREGETGVPRTLADAVALRVGRLETSARETLETAAVVGGRVDPRRLARMGGTSELAVVRTCEELVRLRLMNRVADGYELVNDLVQECVRASLPPPLANALHRSAADTFSDQPEVMAAHAHAAGEDERAARGWWLAAKEAMARSAVDDAIDLFDRSVDVATDDALRSRALVGRARAHEARREYAEAWADVQQALGLARDVGDRRLEMAALRVESGDVQVALRQPRDRLAHQLEAGLRLASGLGDRHSESHFAGRLAAVAASDLQLARAVELADRNLERSRGSSSEDALVLGLDAVKTVSFHLGDGARMDEVCDELVPLLQHRHSTWMLQWSRFESAVAPASRGDLDGALARVSEAVALNTRSGNPLYGGFFLAHGAWLQRLAGDLEGALESGEQALRRTQRVDHPWWYAATAGLHASSLLEAGEVDAAAATARLGLAATSAETARSWRLRCLAPLAAATGDPGVIGEATVLLDSVTAPEGRAWVIGADSTLELAATWAERDPDRAESVLAPLARATTTSWPDVRARVEVVAAQISSVRS